MKKNNYASVKKNILASMVFVPLVPFLLALGAGYFYFASSVEKTTIASMQRIVEDHSHMIETFLAERKTDLELITAVYSFESLRDPKMLKTVFNRLKQKNDAFVDLGVFNHQGVHVSYCGQYELAGKNYKDEFWFREVLKKKYYISDIFLGFRHVPHFIIALAIDINGEHWILRATIDMVFFNDFVNKVRIGTTGEAFVLNTQGLFQTRQRSGGGLMTKDPDFDKYSKNHQGVKTFIEKDFNGETHLYATAWLKDKTWLLVVKQEKADAFQLLQKALVSILIVMFFGGIALVCLAFFITDKIIDRIKKTEAEKGELEGQLIRAGRFAEIGEMSTGFAHEINNPLQIIKSEQSLLEILLKDLAGTETKDTEKIVREIGDSLAQIGLQVDRCSKITGAILRFGRQEDFSLKKVDAKAALNGILCLVEKKATVHGIAIKKDLPEKPIFIQADPAQMQQVFLNLLNNAFDAVDEAHGVDGGKLNIRMTYEATDHTVKIAIEDNGVGISADNREKIFAPFFTTKPVGKGTGLGLSVCLGIIENMGGRISIQSNANQGTIFNVYLPVI